MINLATYREFYDLGMTALPVIFDKNKTPIDFPKHGIEKYSLNEVDKFLHVHNNVNGVAIKMEPPLGMMDFDIKNTDNKTVYDEWFRSVNSQIPDAFRKCCIEKTKSQGYHVYFKYKGLKQKLGLAQNKDGFEVIALYTGGLLSFCAPSPGYKVIHNDFNDIDFLTDDEFEIFTNYASAFNEYESTFAEKIIVDYPPEYESICLQFDTKCTDDVFEQILNDITLFRVKEYAPKKDQRHVPFLRAGSSANYSAKVYFRNKRLLIMSVMKDYPNFHDRLSKDDHSWVLTPARILYNKNKRSWVETIEELRIIAESAGIDIVETAPVTNQSVLTEDRLKFPYDIFPVEIQEFIKIQPIQHEYLAGSALVALSACIGNSVTLEANEGYFVKPILYLAIVAPPGASKSPALKSMFRKLEQNDKLLYARFVEDRKQYKDDLNDFKNRKKGEQGEEPSAPVMKQVLIKDSTIEMAVKILSGNPSGCCILADELSGFLKRMNRYGDNDEVQKWLEMWSGAPVLLQRVTRDENKVDEPFCSIIGGIQPGVLESLSQEENQHNGFYHRFLFVYPKPQEKQNWGLYVIPEQTKYAVHVLMDNLVKQRDNETTIYNLSEDANQLYAEWFDFKNQKYNRATDDNVKGIIAKYQDYCLRFAVLLQAVYDGQNRYPIVDRVNVERAIRLTEYFLGNMNKAIKILAPESPADRLQPHWQDLYGQLPEVFSTKTYTEIGVSLSISPGSLKSFLSRSSQGDKRLFSKIEGGKYEKLY